MREIIPEIPAHAILKFCLTAFLGARVDYVTNENGDEEKCVCIPLARNGLRVGKTGKVSCYAFVNKTRNANVYGWTHYLRLKMSSMMVRRNRDIGYEAPYVGNMKPSNYIAYSKNYNDEVKRDNQRINAKEFLGE